MVGAGGKIHRGEGQQCYEGRLYTLRTSSNNHQLHNSGQAAITLSSSSEQITGQVSLNTLAASKHIISSMETGNALHSVGRQLVTDVTDLVEKVHPVLFCRAVHSAA